MIVPSTIAASVKRSMEVSSWPVAPFAAESARRLVAYGKPALRSRSRPTLLRPPQPAPAFLKRRIQSARGIKYNWFNVVLSFVGAYPVSDFLRSALRVRSSFTRDSGKSPDSCAK